MNLEENLDNIEIKKLFKLFLMAFIQTCLVACNMIFLFNGKLSLLLLSSFGVAYTWTNNVQKIAFSRFKEKIAYCLGASLGTYTGYYLAQYLQKII